MIVTLLLTLAQAVTPPPVELAHVSNTFRFVVDQPVSRMGPLFGPEGERTWAGKHWNPEFLYPAAAKDIQGAVFTVRHGPHNSVWVNTLFDLDGGKIQYVYFIPNALVTTIDVKLTPNQASGTSVEVTYTRTAIDASANEDVRAMGDEDRGSGPHWKRDIEAALSEQ